MATQTIEFSAPTDEQFETAARRVCALMGVDANQAVAAPCPRENGVVLTVYITEPRWKSIERQLRWQFAQMSVLLPHLQNET